MYEEMKVNAMLDLTQTIAVKLFENVEYAWEVLPKIKDFILELGPTLPKDQYDEIAENVWVAKTAKVAESASITGPVIIDQNAEIRHCAFIRGNAIVGANAVVGNSTELKNVVIFNTVQVPHYNYIGDSVLGYKAHFGAGSITSNIKSDRTNVTILYHGEKIETGLRKIGAIVGDSVEIGCNSVLNPGTIIGPHSNVYPLSSVRGFVPANHIYKNENDVVEKK